MVNLHQVGVNVVRCFEGPLLADETGGWPYRSAKAHNQRLALFLLVINRVEEGLVLDDRASNAAAELLTDWSAVHATQVARRELAVSQIIEGTAMPVVSAGLGEDVDHSARGTSKFRREITAHDLELTDRFLTDHIDLVTALSAPLPAKEWLIEIGAVNIDVAVDA